MFYLFTGPGKGKTSAALGMAFRAAGWGYKSVIIQFMKAQKTGEIFKAQQKELIDIYQFGKKGKWTFFKKLTKEDYRLAKAGLDKARECLEQKPFLLVLDEFNLAVGKGLIKLETAVDFLQSVPDKTHVVSTGRHAPPELIKLADLVTEFNELKHPFNKGGKAIRGLDF